MCDTCGCDEDATRPARRIQVHGAVAGGGRRLSIERSLMEKNDAFAKANRDAFARKGILALNLVSSPGSGKTSLLLATLSKLHGRLPIAVIEGDQQTRLDADRIQQSGAPAIQINTGKGCHLDAHRVGHAAEELGLEGGVLMIENVGNLVCPAGFDLGEAHKVVILSITEGEDKPLKYPDMFAAASLMLLNKVDLLPYLEYDVNACVANARRVNPKLRVILTSARSRQGLDAWIEWIDAALKKQTAGCEV